MKKSSMIKACILVFMSMTIMMTGCSDSDDTQMKFSFKSSEPTDSYDERQISIGENIEKLAIDMSLKVDSGSVKIEVIRKSDDSNIWSGTYREDTDFQIILEKVDAGSEYYLIVSTEQTENATITVNSETKLIKDQVTE